MSRSSKQKRILSLDQASVKSGFAVFDGSDLLKWGLLAANKDDESGKRIIEMADKIEELVAKYNPDEVIFEGIQKQQSVQVVIVLARLQGCIIDICRKYHISYSIYQPTTWRSNLQFQQGSAKRSELKRQAVEYVKNAYGLSIGEDVCEAICIGLSHLRQIGTIK